MRHVLIGLLALVLAVAGYALLARFILHGPVNAVSLVGSITDSGEFGTWAASACEKAGSRHWTCMLDNDSDSTTYRVRIEPNGSCWTAIRGRYPDSGFGELPSRATGCVHRWQWSLGSLIQ